MRIRIAQRLIGCVLLVGVVGASRAQEEADEGPRAQIVGGMGLVISPGYNDVLEDAYSSHSVSGGYGWLDLLIGLRLNASKRFSVTPGVALMINFVTGDDSFTNTIILPSVSGRFKFREGSSFYVGGEVNYGIPNSGGDRMDLSSGGTGYGGAIGFEFDADMSVEVGYTSVPVDADTFGDEDFGGGVIKVIGAF